MGEEIKEVREMIDLFLVKNIVNGETPDPEHVYIISDMTKDGRSILKEKEHRDNFSLQLWYLDDRDFHNYYPNWVIKLKRKECSQI